MPRAEPVPFRRGRLSDAEKAVIAEMGDRGLKAGPIARKLNRHRGTVNCALHSLGCTPPARRKPVFFMRNGRPVKSFSKEEDQVIEQLALEGLHPSDIAAELTRRFGHPRKRNSVIVRLTMLANEEEAG